MSTSIKLAKWVNNKPMILIRFDDKLSEILQDTQQGFDHFTIAKPHSIFRGLKLPTLCLLEIQEQDITSCYMATATRKQAVSTFDSRLTIKKLRSIKPFSLKEIREKLTNEQMKKRFSKLIPDKGGFSILSPKLSVHLIEQLAAISDNQAALDTALSLLPMLRQAPNVNWEQEDAIQSAMAIFGIRNGIPDEVVLKRGASSGLSLIGAHLYEDNVVHSDASQVPGFDAIASDVTGRAVFQKGDERLVIYTANKLPLEQMLGVDLIYINETRCNVVMVQYKMLEENKQQHKTDWLFRPDKQLHDEIARMMIPDIKGTPADYRLSRNPFFFKFVKRKIKDNSHKSFLISLDHLNKILIDPNARGPKNGICLSYDKLDGTYLREADMISLIRSGYVGTHREETQALATIIHEVARGDKKALVLAWQQRIQEIYL